MLTIQTSDRARSREGDEDVYILETSLIGKEIIDPYRLGCIFLVLNVAFKTY